ncbi:MAG: tRNA pseudouridine(38-40) synthase TruA [Bacteroidia bacterium]|nr:tRNA pseudouridine(38-40) synthase TruA [Bacteroidia bacterium]
MPRYFASLAYRGTSYHGWQIQPNALSVQETFNKALRVLCRGQVETTGCGRTDTGVHASQFFAHFDLEDDLKDPGHFTFQLNAILPKDIRVFSVFSVHDQAHARFDAVKRSYSYYILRKPDPFLYEYAWYFQHALDLDKMNEAAALCLQREDFSCFAKSGGQQVNNLCRITECSWLDKGRFLQLNVSSNRFLRGMVRAMTGTFIEVGLSKITVEEFKGILDGHNRGEAGKAAPSQGLFLEEICYPYLPSERVYPFQT